MQDYISKKCNLLIQMGMFKEYIGHMENSSTGQSGARGAPVQKGDPGIGFKLTKDGNYDFQNKRVYNNQFERATTS